MILDSIKLIKTIKSKVRGKGYYISGGAMRDVFLRPNHTPNDIDVYIPCDAPHLNLFNSVTLTDEDGELYRIESTPWRDEYMAGLGIHTRLAVHSMKPPPPCSSALDVMLTPRHWNMREILNDMDCSLSQIGWSAASGEIMYTTLFRQSVTNKILYFSQECRESYQEKVYSYFPSWCEEVGTYSTCEPPSPSIHVLDQSKGAQKLLEDMEGKCQR